MPKYLVERQLPDLSSEALAAAAEKAKTASDEMTRAGTPVRYHRSTYVPGESKCYCLFEGESEATVRQANERAGLPFDRISEALHVTAEDVD